MTIVDSMTISNENGLTIDKTIKPVYGQYLLFAF
jgi:hypothetical protein